MTSIKSVKKDPASTAQILRDTKTGQVFLINSMAATGDTLLWEDGKEYPLIDIEITGSNQLVAQPLEIPQIPIEVQLVTKAIRHTLH